MTKTIEEKVATLVVENFDKMKDLVDKEQKNTNIDLYFLALHEDFVILEDDIDTAKQVDNKMLFLSEDLGLDLLNKTIKDSAILLKDKEINTDNVLSAFRKVGLDNDLLSNSEIYELLYRLALKY